MKLNATEIPTQCPSCGSTRIAKVIYGLLNHNEKLDADLDAGRVVSGGCTVIEDEEGNTLSPQWRCLACNPERFAWHELREIMKKN